MESTATSNRIHPLMATAAVSVTLVSLIGAAAIAGLIPNSRGAAGPDSPAVTTNSANAPLTQQRAQAPAEREIVRYKTVVHHDHPRRTQTTDDSSPIQSQAQQA